MKKTFKFFAVAAMASLAAVACNKDNGNNGGNKDDNGGNTDVEGVVIDGNFDDWAKLDEADVVSAVVDAEATAKAIKTMKFYDTKEYIYVYAEVDPAEVGTQFNEAEKWNDGISQPRPLRFVWDIDNSDETGGSYTPEFPEEDWGADVLLDVYFWADNGKIKLGWSEIWNYNSETPGESFITKITQNEALNNMVVTAENVAGDLSKGSYRIELAIDKTNFPDLGKEVKVGCALLKDHDANGWAQVGLMPSDGKPFHLTLK